MSDAIKKKLKVHFIKLDTFRLEMRKWFERNDYDCKLFELWTAIDDRLTIIEKFVKRIIGLW